MSTKWRSKKNYINHQFLQSAESAEWTKTVRFNYKTLDFPVDIENSVKFTGISFFCDNLLVYAEMDQDSFILGLNNHTYLEFKRVESNDDTNGDKKLNRFQLIGSRQLDSLDLCQVVWLQGQLSIPLVTP